MKLDVKEMILAALFAALTAVGAFIKIPIGPAPITLQMIFTILAGIMLGSKMGAISQLVYMIIGLLGLPVFAGGTGGVTSVLSPSFGYVIGFVFGAYVIGKIAEGETKPSFIRLFIASIAGTIVIYLIGVPYLYIVMNNVVGKAMTFANALKFGLLIFIPGDLAKCILGAALGIKVVPAVKKAIA
ncbi:biotin transporter BioY [Clostridium swellfunianum]|uniref:biotin transporter BioY n=1 Tax=Clostridium swellfunianum TaxID=1367462 RepID=UPI00202EF017|nr:biotin transporter BioY [Clostridium swellfunianum]MCM0650950.1 biotin transporter BioY [Clostridium swellfunianum]